jgi:hypothetical protein
MVRACLLKLFRKQREWRILCVRSRAQNQGSLLENNDWTVDDRPLLSDGRRPSFGILIPFVHINELCQAHFLHSAFLFATPSQLSSVPFLVFPPTRPILARTAVCFLCSRLVPWIPPHCALGTCSSLLVLLYARLSASGLPLPVGPPCSPPPLGVVLLRQGFC